MLLSNLEHATEFLLQGWALHEKDPSITVFLDIHINGSFAARVPAHTFRSDLKACGYGTGHHAMFFNPLDYLTRRTNLIEVRESSSAALIRNGARQVETELATNAEAYRQAHLRAQSQWREAAATTAPGNPESAFLKYLLPAVHFHPGLRILEIGIGAGHLLAALLKQRKPFSRYLGLDLSRSQIDAHRAKTVDSRIRFLAGDAARYPFAEQFELILASSVLSSQFPSFAAMLQNTCAALVPGGVLAFDLPVQDDRASISRAGWREDRWLRLYSQQEIRRLLSEAGLELLQTQTFAQSAFEHRVFVTAIKISAIKLAQAGAMKHRNSL